MAEMHTLGIATRMTGIERFNLALMATLVLLPRLEYSYRLGMRWQCFWWQTNQTASTYNFPPRLLV